MSNKNFSAATANPSKGLPDNKAKTAPANNPKVADPAHKQAAVAPAKTS